LAEPQIDGSNSGYSKAPHNKTPLTLLINNIPGGK
jgi:hypothetical protein